MKKWPGSVQLPANFRKEASEELSVTMFIHVRTLMSARHCVHLWFSFVVADYKCYQPPRDCSGLHVQIWLNDKGEKLKKYLVKHQWQYELDAIT